jgi:hypothetical protein
MSLSKLLIRGVCVFVGVVLMAAPSTSAIAEPPVPSTDRSIRERILDQWRARNEQIKTIHAEWESRVFTAASPGSPPRRFLSEFWIDGKGRFRLNEWSLGAPGSKDSKIDSSPRSRRVTAGQWSFNGKIGRGFDGHPPQGRVVGGGGPPMAYDAVVPLMLATCPNAHAHFNVFPGRGLDVASTNAVIGSIHCIKLHEAWIHVGNLWVDPNRDDLIIAWESLRSPDLEFFVTIDYRRDAKYGWLPIGWTSTSPRPSNFPRAEHTVTKLAINEDIAEPTFTLEFPPGTDVLDWSTKERATRSEATTRKQSSRNGIQWLR